MKKLVVIILAISICLAFLISCEEEQLNQELQRQIQIREKAQQEVTNSKNSLYLLMGFSISAVSIAIIIGVAIGSKSRNDAIAQTKIERRKNDEQQK